MSKIINIKTKERLSISSLKNGEVHRIHIHLCDNSLGVPWRVPVIVIKGVGKGPVFGLTAAIHGDELNGVPTIFKLINEIDPKKLNGSIVMLPISNVPGYLNNQRRFPDNIDLNRIFPGRASGRSSSFYVYNLVNKIIKKFDYLLDLHTASHGRVNSLYVRADLENEKVKELAYLQNPQIIIQKYDEEGTLRAWANDQGIPAITIEIGNSNSFQHTLIDETLQGIKNTLVHLKMIPGEVQNLLKDTYVCERSYWIYANYGGIVDVFPKLTDIVQKGDLVAKIYNVYGEIKSEVFADRTGIVVGKNTRPNCDAGTRLVHLGYRLIE